MVIYLENSSYDSMLGWWLELNVIMRFIFGWVNYWIEGYLIIWLNVMFWG